MGCQFKPRLLPRWQVLLSVALAAATCVRCATVRASVPANLPADAGVGFGDGVATAGAESRAADVGAAAAAAAGAGHAPATAERSSATAADAAAAASEGGRPTGSAGAARGADPPATARAAGAVEHSSERSRLQARARTIFKEWARAFGLSNTAPPSHPLQRLRRAPPPPLPGGKRYQPPPPPPHLELCHSLTQRRRELEWIRPRPPSCSIGSDDGISSSRSSSRRNPSAGGRRGHAGKGSGRSDQGESCNDDSGNDGKGVYPSWTLRSASCPHCSPDVPWIRGADSANLPLTRVAQRDIWLHQFPPPGECRSGARRLLLANWLPTYFHGIGSQMHVLSAVLSLAMLHNRTLVITPGTYERARHADCQATGEEGNFSCYFLPSASEECEAVAMEQLRAGNAAVGDESNILDLLPSSTHVIVTDPYYEKILIREAQAARRWGKPWRDYTARLRLAWGGEVKVDADTWQVIWWRSQSLRFFLRWPSAYLCHLTNRARHHSYGFHLAVQAAEAEAELERTSDLVQEEYAAVIAEAEAAAEASRAAHRLKRASMFQHTIDVLRSFIPIVGGREEDRGQEGRERVVEISSEPEVAAGPGGWWWASDRAPAAAAAPGLNDPAAAAAAATAAAGVVDGGSLLTWWNWGVRRRDVTKLGEFGELTSEPFLPRPIVSVHVRQGDKGYEMKLFSFRAFMAGAARLRLHAPDLRRVWLSTEMQSVVDEAKEQPRWSFLFTENERLGKDFEYMHDFEKRVGMASLVETSFVNLAIASQCDAHVGTLGSNWNRMINELRMTNGRLWAPYIALNFGEW